jgi:hypothetical protein
MGLMASPPKAKSPLDLAAPLAQRLSETLLSERIIPRFVDSYVVEHGRIGLQVHAALYKDLLTLLQREALLAASARILDIVHNGLLQDDEKIPAMRRKDATLFRQKFLTALTRQQRWDVSGSLDFQADLQMYEQILARTASQKRTRKAFEAANHPFVDRCAFVLDSSFLEKARIAASRTLSNIEALATELTVQTLAGEKK